MPLANVDQLVCIPPLKELVHVNKEGVHVNLLTHSTNILGTKNMPRSVVGAGDTAVNKIKAPPTWNLHCKQHS